MDKTDHDLLVEIHNTIMGSNGQGGCFRQQTKLVKDFYNFRLSVLLAITAIAGGSGFGFAKLLDLIRPLMGG